MQKPETSAFQQGFAEAAVHLTGKLDALAEAWVERMVEDPEVSLWDRVEDRPAALANARRDIGREVAALQAGFELPSTCPPEIVDSARLAVMTGFPLWGALKAYRVGNLVQWEAWEQAVSSLSVDEDTRRQLLRRGARFMFDYADRASTWMEREYTRARHRATRRAEQRRLQVVRDILDGASVDASALGYDLDQQHLCAVVWGESVEETAEELIAPWEGQALTVSADTSTSWVWLGCPSGRRPDPPSLRALDVPAGTYLALSDLATGIGGFRRAHREAQQARAVAGYSHGRLTLYRDVAVDALALADESQARAFIERELGPLASPGRRASLLRTTLRVYFDCAQRASTAARQLGVHERTIANRLRAVEDQLGHGVHQRHLEIETALRLHRLLGL